MARQVSRENSGPPERKGAIRPDVVGLRQLNERIVEDRPDPARRLLDGPPRHLGLNEAGEIVEQSFDELLKKLDGTD
jgi:hypothetical protein